eukprot:6297554-Lingulodinium_polyedra.AAC.1
MGRAVGAARCRRRQRSSSAYSMLGADAWRRYPTQPVHLQQSTRPQAVQLLMDWAAVTSRGCSCKWGSSSSAWRFGRAADVLLLAPSLAPA